MNYRDVYEAWLASPALSEAERAELEAIQGDEKEIEGRFFAPLEFGTAGLRGTMCTGLHNMNIHVVRHATQAFAEVILGHRPPPEASRYATTAAITPRSLPGRPPASWLETESLCGFSSLCALLRNSPSLCGNTAASPE